MFRKFLNRRTATTSAFLCCMGPQQQFRFYSDDEHQHSMNNNQQDSQKEGSAPTHQADVVQQQPAVESNGPAVETAPKLPKRIREQQQIIATQNLMLNQVLSDAFVNHLTKKCKDANEKRGGVKSSPKQYIRKVASEFDHGKQAKDIQSSIQRVRSSAVVLKRKAATAANNTKQKTTTNADFYAPPTKIAYHIQQLKWNMARRKTKSNLTKLTSLALMGKDIPKSLCAKRAAQKIQRKAVKKAVKKLVKKLRRGQKLRRGKTARRHSMRRKIVVKRSVKKMQKKRKGGNKKVARRR